MVSLRKLLKSRHHRQMLCLYLRYWNVFKTIYLNLRMLPFRQAVRLPIFIFGRVSFVSLRGRIIIDAERIHTAMIQLGDPADMYFNPQHAGVIYNDGQIIFRGRFDAGCGYNLRTYAGGAIIFGENTHLGSKNNFISKIKIEFGDYSRTAFEVVIMDTSFHYTMDMVGHVVTAADSPVKIGKYNWIANRSTVQKGTITPDNLIAASGSLLNRDYTGTVPEYSLIGGTPAKLIKENVTRVWNWESETALRETFNSNGADSMEFPDLPLK